MATGQETIANMVRKKRLKEKSMVIWTAIWKLATWKLARWELARWKLARWKEAKWMDNRWMARKTP